ncbi:efflux transporter outer membrane subunit [Niveibacterium sp. SC-1]|uniref:efflux transporter outer membrane subunit n=1 Tax=Niveibacterium sp. SC-1 TaxID=3135646 RepID=UPI00311F6E37
MKTPSFLLPAAAALTLAACASSGGLAPTGQLRNANTVQAATSLSAAPVSEAAWPAGDWWTQLGDHQLDGLIGEALQGNPDLAVVDARAQQAAARAAGADAARMPTVGAKASLPGMQLPKELAPSLDGDFSFLKLLSLNFNYTFDLWGGERAAWEAALGEQRAAEVDAKAARLSLSADVARAYSQLAYAYQARDVAKSDLQRAQGLLELTRKRLKAGLDSEAQLHQGEADEASAEQRLAQANNAVESAQVALASLLGQGPDRGLSLQRPQVLQPVALAVPANLPADLIGRRPDIVAARWRVEAASQGIKNAKAGFYPNVNLSGAIGLISAHTSDLLQLSSRYAFVTPAISLPIFDGGRLRANLAGRDADYDLAVAQYNKTLVSAFNQVAEQVHTLRSLQEQEAAQRRALVAAQQAWDLAMLRYKNGVGSYLEVLIVQKTLLGADLQLAAIHAQQIDNSVLLVRALGGGYSEPAPQHASTDVRAAGSN